MQGEVIEIGREMAEARIGVFHWRLCAMVAALAFFDGYDVINPAYVIHYVMGPWGLRPAQAGLLISSGLVGFLIGAAAHGVVADRIGRRGTLLAGLWIISVLTLATALFAHSFPSYCALRVVTGLGLGVLMPLGTTYINEFAPRRAANVFPIWGVTLGWSLGGTAAGLVGVFVTPIWGWQSLYYFGSLSFVLTIALHFMLPESIAFLEMRGRTAEAGRLLARLRPERAAAYATAVFVAPPAPAERPSIRRLLAPQYRRTTIAIWAAAFLSLFGVFGLTGWLPTVMIQRGETFAASFGFGALMQVTSFIGGLTCGYLADRIAGSRLQLMVWWGVGGLTVWMMAALDSHVANLLLTGAAGFFVVGAQHVLNNFAAKSYETGLRATGVGMELSVGRVGAILGPFIVGALQQAYPGATVSFLAIGAASVCAGAMMVFAAPAGLAMRDAGRPVKPYAGAELLVSELPGSEMLSKSG